jgi:hypothetical protein
MTLRASYGMANPNSFFDAKTVREIRLQHLCDMVSASQIARDLGVNVSCVSRIVNWKSWAGQDQDLRSIPKPGHKGGDKYHRPKSDPVVPVVRLTCRTCLHLGDDSGSCDFGFPECLSSAYKFASKCCVYKPLTSHTKHGSAN